MAGFMAERRWTSRRPGRGSDWLAAIREGADPDFRRADDLADWANGGDYRVARAWMDWITERVKARLGFPPNCNWSALWPSNFSSARRSHGRSSSALSTDGGACDASIGRVPFRGQPWAQRSGSTQRRLVALLKRR